MSIEGSATRPGPSSLEERRIDAEAVSEAVAGIRELREELRSQGRLSSLEDIRAAIDEGRM